MHAWGRTQKWVAGSLAAVVLLMGVAWLALPGLLQSQLQTRGSELLGRELRVERVEVAPWSLALTLHGLRLAASPAAGAGAAPQLAIRRVLVDADLRSLLKLAPVIEAIEVDAPQLRVVRGADGRWDFEDVVERLAKPDTPPPPEPEAPARFALFNLQLREGSLHFDDRLAGRVHEAADVMIALPFLSNLPADVQVHVQPALSMAWEGRRVELTGKTLPFTDTRATELQLSIDGADLRDAWAYLPASVPLRPEGGAFDAKLSLSFSQPPGGAARVALGGRVAVRQLAVKNRAGAPMLKWQALEVALADVRPLERVVQFGAVTLDGAEVDVRRDARGQLEWAALGGQAETPATRPKAAPAPAPATASSPASKPASAAAAQPVFPAAAMSASAPAPAAAASAAWAFGAASVQVNAARVIWQDAAVRPAVALAAEDLTLSIEQPRWPTAGPVPLKLATRVAQGGKTVGTLQVEGRASEREAALGLTLGELQLAAAGPYLRAALRPTLDGRGSAAGRVDWAAGDTPRARLLLDELRLEGLRLSLPRERVPLASVALLRVAQAQVDLLAQRVSLGEVALRSPNLRLRRAADGHVDAQDWLVPADAAPAPAGHRPEADSGWRAELAHFKLDGGRLFVSDAAARPGAPGAPVEFELAALQVGVRGFSWPASARAARVNLAAQLSVPPVDGAAPEPPGRLKARGTLALAPLAWRGPVEIERFPVAAFEPYFGGELLVQLARGEIGLRSEIELAWPAEGLSLNATGDVRAADVQLRARPTAQAAGEELMSWQSLTLAPVRVAMAPSARPQVEIGELRWNDFYSRLVITEDGRFNLRDVGAQPAAAADAASAPPAASAPGVAAASASTPPAASTPAVALAAAPPASAASGAGAGGGLPLDLIVDRTVLVNGRVDFSDRFVRPNYSAALSELNGTLGRVDSRTRDMAALELKGRAAGTALLEIRGALNPTADPLALDITARATDLELAPLSPYAGKYAGYAIERGKLSMDVSYRIEPDGKLEAKNQVILNQLTFGDKIDSPDATKLPVRLAVALLTDRNGVIDLNLPISGSINDPKFSIWGIVWKLVGNLLVKAFTAPFALLAGGDATGPDLSVVPFVPGTAQLSTGSAAALERVAQALNNRPALRMTVTGAADPVSEREAIRRAALEARIAAEHRRELARAGVPAAAASAPPGLTAIAAPPALTAAQREALVKRLYADTRLPDKPRNLIGMAKDIPVAQMEDMLRAATLVSNEAARELAIQRGLAVRDALIARGLSSERLFIGAPRVHLPGADDAAWSPRVQLSLTGP